MLELDSHNDEAALDPRAMTSLVSRINQTSKSLSRDVLTVLALLHFESCSNIFCLFKASQTVYSWLVSVICGPYINIHG